MYTPRNLIHVKNVSKRTQLTYHTIADHFSHFIDWSRISQNPSRIFF